VRALWRFIADGTIRAIRPPGVRRVLVDRADLDELLTSWKRSSLSTHELHQ
jgi:excisionase family DNA binding protein